MFDRVELKLRWYGSKCVVKYPRCSLRRQSTYADAKEDLSQVFTLASIWVLFLAIGNSACVVPIIYTIGLAYRDAFNSRLSYINQAPALEFLGTVNGVLFMFFGFLVGYPITSSSVISMSNPSVLVGLMHQILTLRFLRLSGKVKVLQGLWRNDFVALKGACPNCGEEVFAFMRLDQSNDSPHTADCHVCESLLEFRTKAKMPENVTAAGTAVATNLTIVDPGVNWKTVISLALKGLVYCQQLVEIDWGEMVDSAVASFVVGSQAETVKHKFDHDAGPS